MCVAFQRSPFVGEMGLGFPVVPFYPFLGEGSPTKIDYRKKSTLFLSSLLEDVGVTQFVFPMARAISDWRWRTHANATQGRTREHALLPCFLLGPRLGMGRAKSLGRMIFSAKRIGSWDPEPKLQALLFPFKGCARSRMARAHCFMGACSGSG